MNELQELLKVIEQLPEQVGMTDIATVLPSGVYVDTGVSRIVFFKREWDYVIKINRTDSRNDCHKEVEKYNQIFHSYPDFLPLFSRIRYLGLYGNHRVYKQDKIYSQMHLPTALYNQVYKQVYKDGMLDNFSHSEHYQNLVDIFSVDELWLGWICLKYGIEYLEILERLLNALRINDLHSDNIGYTRDLSPCICDYAGYGIF